MSEELKFGEALTELEQIVRAIESEQVDLDELADKVDRASELVAFCRERIATTELRVQSIIEGLDPEEDEP